MKHGHSKNGAARAFKCTPSAGAACSSSEFFSSFGCGVGVVGCAMGAGGHLWGVRLGNFKNKKFKNDFQNTRGPKHK